MLAVWRRSLACHAGHSPSPAQLQLLSVSLLPAVTNGLAGCDRLGPGGDLGAPAPRRPLFSLPGADDGLAKRYRERKLLGYTPQQIYDVVAAVEHYREFVPWCQGSSILAHRGPTALDAELEVGFQVFVERYVSHVTLDPPRGVRSHVGETALFTHLDSGWRFDPGPTPASAWMTFEVDFAFKSPLYRKVAALFFEEVVVKMMSAFEGRCRRLYGASSLGPGGAAAAAALRRRQAEAAEAQRWEEEDRRGREAGGPAPVES